MGAYSQVPTAWQMPLYGSRFPKGKRQYLGKQEVAGGDPTNLSPLLWFARLSSVLFLWVRWHLNLPSSKPEICSGFLVKARAPTEHLSSGSGNGLEKNCILVAQANKSQNRLTPKIPFSNTVSNMWWREPLSGTDVAHTAHLDLSVTEQVRSSHHPTQRWSDVEFFFLFFSFLVGPVPERSNNVPWICGGKMSRRTWENLSWTYIWTAICVDKAGLCKTRNDN